MDHKRLLIDTSVLIDHLRKTKKNQTIFYRFLLTSDYVISAITEFEFSVGSSATHRHFIEQWLANIPVLAFDSSCAPVAADIYRQLKSKNQLIPIPDILIAATAIVHDLPLLTLNQKHFARIPNLQLHDER